MNTIDITETDFALEFIWIPADVGGHKSEPYTGMRLSIRWQKFLEAYLQCARDVECRILSFDQNTSRGIAICSLYSREPVPVEWIQEGQLIELLNGFRVVAVGKIILMSKEEIK